jgi:hypothetical protein
MKSRNIEFVTTHKLHDRGLEEIFVGTILAPSPMPFVDIGPVDLVPPYRELVPLDSGVENKKNVVKNLVARKFTRWSAMGS